MALAQHLSIPVRFKQQVENAENYLIPFIEEVFPLNKGMEVMEIGCGEGGVLQPFAKRGMNCLGVDLNKSRIENARAFFADSSVKDRVEFLVKNVYDENFLEKFTGKFDLIILKDTIEHIPDQEKFIPYLTRFLKPSGKVFFGFPPWRMPFGGHQQICSSKVLGYMPWVHLLPKSLYKGILKAFGEPKDTIDELMEIKDTGISIRRFEKIIRENRLNVDARTLFLFNPIYRYKFGLTPRKQFPILAGIPYLKDFYTTAGWYLVSGKK